MDALVVTMKAEVLEAVRTALLAGDGTAATEALVSPRAALAWIDEEPSRFDVVIADADTTPMGGFALARELKARARVGRAVPRVVLLIARAQDEWLAEWSEADAWSLKPVDPFDLAEAVRAVVDDVAEPPALPAIRYGGGPMREDAKQIEREAGEGPAGGFSGGAP